MAKRRGNNEGSISKRKDGTWEYKISAGYNQNGSGKRKGGTARTREEAHARLVQLLADQHSGILTDAKGHTLGSYLDWWLEHRSTSIAPNTHRAYRHALRKLDGLRKIPLQNVKPIQIERVYTDMIVRQRKSPRTVQITHTTLHSAIKDAVRLELLATDFMLRVKPPRQRRPDIKVWSRDEIRTFLASCRGDRLYPLVYLAVTSGMRRAELLGLHWRDVTIDDASHLGRIYVRRNLVTNDGQVHVKEPKTPASRRVVHVRDDVVSVLAAHRERQAIANAELGIDWTLDDPVFQSETGGYLDPNNVSRSFRRLISRADVTPVGLHALRHTHASLLIAGRTDAKLVSERLGHTSVAFTQTVYQHLYDEQRAETAIGLSDVLGDAMPSGAQA